MTTVLVSALQPGEHIRVGPHDIWRHSGDPQRKGTPTGDVTVDAVVEVNTLAVIMCHAGPVLGAAVYDLDDEVERVA